MPISINQNKKVKNKKSIQKKYIWLIALLSLILVVGIILLIILTSSSHKTVDLTKYEDKTVNIERHSVTYPFPEQDEVEQYISNNFKIKLSHITIEYYAAPGLSNNFCGCIDISAKENDNYYKNGCSIEVKNSIPKQDLLSYLDQTYSDEINFLGYFSTSDTINETSIINRIKSILPTDLTDPNTTDTTDPGYYNPIDFFTISNLDTSTKTFHLSCANAFYDINDDFSYDVSNQISLTDVFGNDPHITLTLIRNNQNATYYRDLLVLLYPSLTYPNEIDITPNNVQDTDGNYSLTITTSAGSSHYLQGTKFVKFHDNSEIWCWNEDSDPIYNKKSSFKVTIGSGVQNFVFDNEISNTIFSITNKVTVDSFAILTNAKKNYTHDFDILTLTSAATITEDNSGTIGKTKISINSDSLPAEITTGTLIEFSINLTLSKTNNDFLWDNQKQFTIDFSCYFVNSSAIAITSLPGPGAANGWDDQSWNLSENSTEEMKIECEGGESNWTGVPSNLLDITDDNYMSCSWSTVVKHLNTAFSLTNDNKYFAINKITIKLHDSYDFRYIADFRIQTDNGYLTLASGSTNGSNANQLFTFTFKKTYYTTNGNNSFFIGDYYYGGSSFRSTLISWVKIN